MLTVGLVDANEKAGREWAGIASSVIGGWLRWEAERVGLSFGSPATADVVLLVFAGALDYIENTARELRRVGIDPDSARRQGRPYIITGGPIDATPLTALSIADALAVGEAYAFIRMLFQMIVGGAAVEDIQAWVTEYPHAIERGQVAGLARDPRHPWLLAKTAPKLARPDTYIDWGVPPVRSDDKVVRVIGSKGCHFKCTFCATTYRQTYQRNENEGQVLGTLAALKKRGERVQIVSNDPLNLPYYRRIKTRLDSQSFTVQEMQDADNRRAVIRAGIGIARFGVEGISERIRKAFAKPIANDELLAILAELHAHKVNTHMFFIVGAPYETTDDWQELREFYARLATTIRSGICRIKLTTFVNTPPAPLARYVPGLMYEQEQARFRDWVSGNAASRHLVYVRGRGGKTHLANVAEQLAVPVTVVTPLAASACVDLAPTLEEARRLTWEVVEWPLPVELRWRMGEVYRKKMAGTTQQTQRE